MTPLTGFLGTAMLLSLGIVIVMAVVFIRRVILFCSKKDTGTGTLIPEKTILKFSGIILVSLYLMRYAVSIYFINFPEKGDIVSTWWEELFSCLVATLQSFSMDADYEKYMRGVNGAAMLVFGRRWINVVYRIYASLLNVFAPIAGGAVLLDVLANIFPRIKIWLTNKFSAREKYYLSELNERSLALAKSILKDDDESDPKPVVIFTDTYLDDENEKSSELVQEAKSIGAVCLKDDILHVKISKKGAKKYFLIDDQEVNNLHTLTKMAEMSDIKCLKNAEILLFSQDDVYVQVDNSFRNMLKGKLEDPEMPRVVPIQCYRRLASNLLTDVPLYEPVVHKKKVGEKTEINVTVLGTGSIGTEMLLSSYWCGQMLDNKLRINVVSNEPSDDFWGRLDNLNMDIVHSVSAGDDILVKNANGECSEPYCSLNFFEADVRFDNAEELLQLENNDGIALFDTDYFIVALGSDDLNLAVADKLRQQIGKYHLEKKSEKRTVIAYAIYDTEMCEALNSSKYFESVTKGSPDIYMHAFGSMGEMYSKNNIFMLKFDMKAHALNQRYNATSTNVEREKANKDRIKDDYTYWANIARAAHLPYKVFSAGCITGSVFDLKEREEYGKKRAEDYDTYQALVHGENFNAENTPLVHRLAWLEHRRWNAFMRVRGFRFTEKYVEYYNAFGSHKSIPLRLHPCLVECDEKNMNLPLDSQGNPLDYIQSGEKTTAADLLDEVSLKLHEAKKKKGDSQYDFKIYDYPAYDF